MTHAVREGKQLTLFSRFTQQRFLSFVDRSLQTWSHPISRLIFTTQENVELVLVWPFRRGNVDSEAVWLALGHTTKMQEGRSGWLSRLSVRLGLRSCSWVRAPHRALC